MPVAITITIGAGIIKAAGAVTGKNKKGGMGMPTIFFYGPKLTRDKKVDLIRDFTRAAGEATGIREEAFVVYLQETAPDQVGVGGKLLEERQKKS